MLIIDNAPTHPAAKTSNKIDDDLEVMILALNTTVLLQPMAHGIIEKLKRTYGKQTLLRPFWLMTVHTTF